MKTIIFLAVIAFAVADPELYDVVTLDMDKMEKDPQEFKSLIDCLLDRGPCTPVFQTYRGIVQEATENICKKCNPYQKRAYWHFLRILRTTNPVDYENFRQKFDADNVYVDILESVLRGFANLK
ncbi:allergen Tha p 1-like [Danaus plexippus]|uniref:allergen Tha p 1-like n=1 Tax=Danaus plexippus TaxID=13037 RepID=UPI002AAF37F2|nr:allergen Tha p 1-like [Danaus plexippus]